MSARVVAGSREGLEEGKEGEIQTIRNLN